MRQYIISLHEDFDDAKPEHRFLETFYDALGPKKYREVLGNVPSFHPDIDSFLVVDVYRELNQSEKGTLIMHGFTPIDK